MPQSRTIPVSQSPDVTTFTILVNGNAISRTYNVLKISVRLELNRISTAHLTITDGDAASGEFAASESEDFVPGNDIEIKTGYHSDESTIFKGMIISQRIQVKNNGKSFLTLECKDKAVKMTVGLKNKYYYEQTESDIFQELIERYGLQSDVKMLSTTHAEVVQYNCTDWDFLISRVEKNGLFFWIDGDTAKIFSPVTTGEPAVNLTFGATVLNFEGEIDARSQYKSVKSFAWDYANQESLEVEGSSDISLNGNLTSIALANVVGLDTYELRHGGKVIESELQAWADAQLMRSQLAKTRGRVQFQGVPEVKPGVIISLAGFGDRFNGDAFVSGVHHTIANGNWKIDAQLGLSPEWFEERFNVSSPPATGLIPAISGLQIGLVSQLENDPEGENRILVRLPILNPDEQGVWARIANMDAGDNRGSFFLPEIGDEVLVGFINDDPRDPIVLGMLHSSAKPAPLTASDDNHEKGWVTRSEMKVIFDDDKKSIKIETPAGNKIILDEDEGAITLEDQNANKVIMNSDGITIESPGKIEIKASQDLSMEGMNIDGKANMQFKAEGSAGAELSSSGSTTIKGSMVQIN
jgi:Rhs element Vgr protein